MKVILIATDIICAIALVYIAVFGLTTTQPIGSVGVTSEYNSTTTPVVMQTLSTLKAGQGTLGSVIVTIVGAAGGRTVFYDATTTSVLLRTGNLATSTITIASLATNTAVGVYTYDVAFTRGLIMDTTAAIGTTTVTYR